MGIKIASVLIGIVWPVLFIVGMIKPSFLLSWAAEPKRWRAFVFSTTLLPFFAGIGLLFDGQLIGIFFLLPALWPVLCWRKRPEISKTDFSLTQSKKDKSVVEKAIYVEQNTVKTPDVEKEKADIPILEPVNLVEEKGIQVSSYTNEDSYLIVPAESRCSCPDWEKRRSHLPQESPCRVCKHLAKWYAKYPDSLPEPLYAFRAMIEARAAERKGMPAGEECRHGELNGQMFAFGISKENWPWVEIMVEQTRYGLNMEEERWSYGREPAYPLSLLRRVAAACGMEYKPPVVSLPSIEKMAVLPDFDYKESSFDAVTDDAAFYDDGWSELPTHESTIDGDVIPLLRDALGTLPEGLDCVQRKAYFVVYGTKPRNWFCRVKYNAYGLTEVELFNGHIVNITSGHIYRNSQAKFVRLAGEFNWSGEKTA